jgi:hypothetical protein
MITTESMYPGDDFSTSGVKLIGAQQVVGPTASSADGITSTSTERRALFMQQRALSTTPTATDAGLPDAGVPDAATTQTTTSSSADAAAVAMVAAVAPPAKKPSNVPMYVFVSLLGVAGVMVVIAAARGSHS